MKILSLFDGISCGMVALERAGIPVERYDAFEIDKYAIQVSENNYPEIIHHGNVFDGDFTEFKGYDLLIGGSPCTYWSIAKKGRETTADGEGFRLFMQYVRAKEESECRYFLYENNYSIHQNIKDEISKKLGVEPVMINSALVSAQQRKRCYWTNIPNVTQPEDKGFLLKDIILPVDNVPEKYWYRNRSFTLYEGDVCVRATLDLGNTYSLAKRVYDLNHKCCTLCCDGGGGNLQKKVYQNGAVRKLTPVEYERLQTLPDKYTEGVADSHRYSAIGNGWTVDVIAHILGFIPEKPSENKYCRNCLENGIQLSFFR